jgi:hypothetical protein
LINPNTPTGYGPVIQPQVNLEVQIVLKNQAYALFLPAGKQATCSLSRSGLIRHAQYVVGKIGNFLIFRSQNQIVGTTGYAQLYRQYW